MTEIPEQQYLNYIRGLKNDVEDEKTRAIEARKMAASTMFNSEENQHIVKWQLDVKEELERIEHLLRKHIPKRDSDGNEYFIEAKQVDKVLNEKGVNEILNCLGWYLNKNIILSDFTDDEISLRVEQFGIEFSDFLFNNCEAFGMDTADRKKHYPILVMNVVNMIEAAYHRALYGNERNSFRTNVNVLQSDMNKPSQSYMPSAQSKFSVMRPWTWGGK